MSRISPLFELRVVIPCYDCLKQALIALAGSFSVAVDGGEVLKFMSDAVFGLSHRARRAKTH
jgi:hypothetical protein